MSLIVNNNTTTYKQVDQRQPTRTYPGTVVETANFGEFHRGVCEQILLILFERLQAAEKTDLIVHWLIQNL